MNWVNDLIKEIVSAQSIIILAESVVVTFFLCVLINSMVMPFLRRKRIARAKQAGHCLTASRTKFVYNVEGIHSKASNYTGYFQYAYRGKKYKSYYYFDDLPPMEMNVYFSNNPKKAKPEELFGNLENEKYIVFLFVLLIMEVFRISLFGTIL